MGEEMSTHWDIVCLDCNVGMGLRRDWSTNHGDSWMLSLLRQSDELRKLAEAAYSIADATESDGCGVEIVMCYGGYNGLHLDLWLFKDHAGHNLGIKSEYGDRVAVSQELSDEPPVIFSPVERWKLGGSACGDEDEST